MISPELIRRYPFFAGLSHDDMITLAQAAHEVAVEPGHYFFREGDQLDSFYVVVEGAAVIVMEVPARDVEPTLSEQFAREFKTEDIVISSIGPGDMFGWSGLIPPHESTASAKAMTSCRVIEFDCRPLRAAFEEDCRFGYLMMQKAAQVIRERLRDTRLQSLAEFSAA